MIKNQFIILVGNIGAGKSTYVKSLVKQGYRAVSKDAIRYMLGGNIYIFDEQLERVVHRIALDSLICLAHECYNIVIDETNMSIEEREEYLHYIKRHRYEKTALVFPKLTKEESVKRRLKNNHGNTSEVIWNEVWERKNKEYQIPTKEEGFDNIVIL